MGVAAAAGIAAAVAGGILIHKNVSAQKIISEAQSASVKANDIKAEAENILDRADGIKVESKKILEKGESVLDEVTGFITEGAKKNYDDVLDESGNVIRKYKTHEIDGKKVLDKTTEFAADGTKKRATTLYGNGGVQTVEDFAEKVKYKYRPKSFGDKTPYRILKGYEKLPNGEEKAAELFEYDIEKGGFKRFAKNIELSQFGTEKKRTKYFPLIVITASCGDTLKAIKDPQIVLRIKQLMRNFFLVTEVLDDTTVMKQVMMALI